MATDPQEMEDLAHIIGALLVNLGTLTAGTLESMRKAGRFTSLGLMYLLEPSMFQASMPTHSESH